MELIKYAEESADIKIRVDMYGGGPDQDAAKAKADSLELDMPFHGPVDHAELAFTHKIFVNPSTSEVLCTTSAEALAMVRNGVSESHRPTVSHELYLWYVIGKVRYTSKSYLERFLCTVSQLFDLRNEGRVYW